MNKLVCPECRHENEVERIYCHECGARLDRSKVKVEQAAVETPEQTRKRLKRMLGERWSPVQRGLFTVAKVMVFAALAALVVLMFLPPEELPEKPDGLSLASQMTLDLENALLSRQGAQLRFSQEDVNGFFQAAMKTRKKDLDLPLLKFERALVVFDQDLALITVQRSLFGLPIYTTAMYGAENANSVVNFKNRGGRIGRLEIDPRLMEYGDVLLADFWKALDREHTAVKKFTGVYFEPKSVVLVAPSA